MDLLNRQSILDAVDIQQEQVSVPEWGGDVLVYGLTAGEKDVYEDGMVNATGKKKVTLKDATARLCSMCIKDENGDRLFSNDDIAALGKKSAKAMERISDAAMRLSGMTKGDIEEIVKNSETIRKEDSD